MDRRERAAREHLKEWGGIDGPGPRVEAHVAGQQYGERWRADTICAWLRRHGERGQAIPDIIGAIERAEDLEEVPKP